MLFHSEPLNLEMHLVPNVYVLSFYLPLIGWLIDSFSQHLMSIYDV